MDVDDCPLPEVASVLKPFIRPRDEVSVIRRNLQAYLETQLPGDDDETPLTAANLTLPPDDDLKEAPSALTGVRKAYWKALQANQAAQAKYDDLKADLEALKRPSQAHQHSENSINDSYIPLLRQKEKLRRLKVLDGAFSSLPALPSESLEDHVKSQLGAQPTPPSTRPPSATRQDSPELEAKLLALKKAVLTIQRRVQDQENRNAVAKASLPENDDIPNGAKIAGLQNALGELTSWMEEMLGIIADAEAEASSDSVPPTPGAGGGANGAPARNVDLNEIETAYERYVHSRRRLVQSLANPPDSDDSDDNTEPLFPPPPSTNATSHSSNKPCPSELLLPHIPHLTHLKSQEADLLQQKAFIRRQLTASEAETANVVRRLAGESHLVQPGASRGEDWYEAGREANAETEKVVGERVKRGEEWCRKAREAVEAVEGVGEMVGGVEGRG